MGIKKSISRSWHKLSSLGVFEKTSIILAPWCWGMAFVLLCTGIYWGLFIAPADYQQKDVFRIIYTHVPAAIMSMGIYVSMALSAIVGFVWKIKLGFYYCRAMAILGAGFTALALFTGAVWGKPMWGTYWSWEDARLLSELLLLFIYLGYIGLMNAIEQEHLADKIGAILLMVGIVNIPIIHYSVVWWTSLHQGATILKFGKPSITMDMLIPLLICIAGFFFFTVAYALTATRAKIIEAKNQRILLKQLNSQ